MGLLDGIRNARLTRADSDSRVLLSDLQTGVVGEGDMRMANEMVNLVRSARPNPYNVGATMNWENQMRGAQTIANQVSVSYRNGGMVPGQVRADARAEAQLLNAGVNNGIIPDQNTGYYNNNGYVDPNNGYVDPNNSYIDPNNGYVDPNNSYVDPRYYAQPQYNPYYGSYNVGDLLRNNFRNEGYLERGYEMGLRSGVRSEMRELRRDEMSGGWRREERQPMREIENQGWGRRNR